VQTRSLTYPLYPHPGAKRQLLCTPSGNDFARPGISHAGRSDRCGRVSAQVTPLPRSRLRRRPPRRRLRHPRPTRSARVGAPGPPSEPREQIRPG